jgi:hypothetical protein
MQLGSSRSKRFFFFFNFKPQKREWFLSSFLVFQAMRSVKKDIDDYWELEQEHQEQQRTSTNIGFAKKVYVSKAEIELHV